MTLVRVLDRINVRTAFAPDPQIGIPTDLSLVVQVRSGGFVGRGRLSFWTVWAGEAQTTRLRMAEYPDVQFDGSPEQGSNFVVNFKAIPGRSGVLVFEIQFEDAVLARSFLRVDVLQVEAPQAQTGA